MLAYPVHLEPAEEGGFVVTFPDIPEACTQGNDEADALSWAQGALETTLEIYIDRGLHVPHPSSLNGRLAVILPVVVSGKVILHNTLIDSGKTRADLALMLNLQPALVERLMSLQYKSKIEQIETALAAFGKRLVVDAY